MGDSFNLTGTYIFFIGEDLWILKKECIILLFEFKYYYASYFQIIILKNKTVIKNETEYSSEKHDIPIDKSLKLNNIE